MDEENAVVNYVLVIRKSPLLLGLTILFTGLALHFYNEWASLVETDESEES